MKAELIEALNALEKERGIDKEILIEAIETALVSAYKKNFGAFLNVRVAFDTETGDFRVFNIKTIVEEYTEDKENEILITDTVSLDENKKYQPGDVIEFEITPDSFGRIAAQMAKQVVVQRIREVERGLIYDEYTAKESEVVNCTVQLVERNCAFVELDRTEGILPSNEMIPGETLSPGKHIKVYILEVKKTARAPQIIVSRTHPGLVKRLFELEVPELQNGVIQIRNIAREAGYRTKIAVNSNDPQVDALGACVGQKGIRVEHIVQELNNEKIDIIKWSQDVIEFIANALSPAKVIMVQINESERAAKVVVPDSQLSLAIGKEGQNARLAVKLTGWKIDIKSQSQAFDMFASSFGDDFEESDEDEPQEAYTAE